jgi:hypothetical protein
MPIQHNQPFPIQIQHSGEFTDVFRVRFAKDPGGEEALAMDIPKSELVEGKVEKLVTLPAGNYLASATAKGPGGESLPSVPQSVPVFAPVPNTPVLIIIIPA